MVRIVVEITGETSDPQGIKEKLATDFEKYGNVRIASVTSIEDQMKITQS